MITPSRGSILSVLRVRALAAAVVLWLVPTTAPALLGDCGQPSTTDVTPTAADALEILKTAIGLTSCGGLDTCVCDVDSSGTVLAEDALRVLRKAVGQNVELSCSCSDFSLVTEAEIEPGGGVLEGEGFRLTVPPGAFETTVTLSLYVSETAAPYGDDARTPVYRIEGLPRFLDVGLGLSLDYDGELSGQTWIMDGRSALASDTLEEEVAYVPLQTTVNTGTLTATVTGETPVGTDAGDRGTAAETELSEIRFFLGITGGSDDSSQRFHVYGFDGHEQTPATVRKILETELDFLIQDWGLPWDASDVRRPIQVEISKEDPERCVVHLTGGKTDELPAAEMTIGANYVDPEIRQDLPGCLGRSLFYTYQYICEGGVSANFSKPDQLCLHLGFANWAMEIFTVDPDFTRPPEFAGNEARVLSGMLAGLGADPPVAHVAEQGVGTAPIAKFLWDDPRFGLAGLKQMLADVRSGKDVMPSMLDAVTVPVEQWLPEFFSAYFAGQIYGVDPTLLTANPIDEWTADRQHAQFLLNNGNPVSVPDFGAKSFPIHLAASYAPHASLHVEVSSDEVADDRLSVILLAVEPGGLRPLGHGYDWALSDLQEELVDKGVHELQAVVVNGSHALDYRRSSKLYVNMELQEELYNAVELQLVLNLWLHVAGYEEPFYFPAEHLDWLHGEGAISGTSFYIPIDYTVGSESSYGRMVGHIEGVMGENFATVESMSAEQTWSHYTDDVLDSTTVYSATVTGPIAPVPGYPAYFSLDGAQTCSHLDEIMKTYSAGSDGSSVLSWNCDAQSSLFIGFYNQ